MDTIPTKQISTLREYDSMTKSAARPDATLGVHSDLARPSLTSIAKSANEPPVRMGKGVDPHSVVASDLEDYRIWKNGGQYRL